MIFKTSITYYHVKCNKNTIFCKDDKMQLKNFRGEIFSLELTKNYFKHKKDKRSHRYSSVRALVGGKSFWVSIIIRIVRRAAIAVGKSDVGQRDNGYHHRNGGEHAPRGYRVFSRDLARSAVYHKLIGLVVVLK